MNTNSHYLAVFTSNKQSPKWRAWYAMSAEEKRAKDEIGLAALKAWDEAHKDDIVYAGGPLGPTKRTSEAGVADVVNELTVFVVVRATSHDAAAKLFEGHPHFTIFPCDGVEVMPLLSAPPKADASLYEQIGGFDTVLALCRRWHALCLADPVAAHPFEHGLHPQHDERLAAYLSEAFGGPRLYTAGYGDESHMQRLHAGNGEHVELDEACLARFDQALADVGVTGAAAMRISAYFRAATEAQRSWAAAAVPAGLAFRFA